MAIIYTILLVLFISSSKALKIVLSNTATTAASTSTTAEETVYNTHDTTEDSKDGLLNTTTSATLLATTVENVWPEFPPKKVTQNSVTTPTTSIPTTRSIIVAENENDTKNSMSGERIEKRSSTYCFCDLHLDDCDINCCCDPNCDPTVFKSFTCSNDPLFENSYKGRFEDPTLRQNFPSCEHENRWLCLFWSNAHNRNEDKFIETTYYHTSRYYTWPNLVERNNGEEPRDFFKYGDPLQIVNINTRYIESFDLPSNFKSPYCHSEEPIRHLMPFKRSCLMTQYEELIELQELLIRFKNTTKILSKPQIDSDSKNLKSDIADFRIIFCNISLETCFPNVENLLEMKNLKNIVLSEVIIKILHNFTHISGSIIQMWYKQLNIDKNDEQTTAFWINMEVDFYNRTIEEVLRSDFNKLTKIISGPLGYLMDQPIIVAKYVPYSLNLPLESEDRELNYFHETAVSDNTLAILRRYDGLCHRDKKPYNLVHFGINVMISCKIRLNNTILLNKEPHKVNFSSLCLRLQEEAQYQLFSRDINPENLKDYFVSALGKPRNQTDKWLPLQIYNFDFNPAVGQYNEQTNSFVCHNIQLSLSYEFHMSTERTDEIPYQNVIKRAALVVGQRHDLEFGLDEEIEVPLVTTIRFYDLNAPSASKGSRIKSWFNAILIIIFS